MDDTEARTRLLDAAESLFYERGVQAVGMDDLRAAAGVSLKRLYQCFASKQEIVVAYLRRRDERWRADLAAHVASRGGEDVKDRVAAVFGWLHAWFWEPGFRGCAFVNAFGELGGVSDEVARAAADHKQAVHAYVAELVAGLPGEASPVLADQVMLLMEGAIATAAVGGDPDAALRAGETAAVLVAAAPVSAR